MKDVIFLVADNNIKYLMEALLKRIPQIERINNFTYDVVVDTNRDPGVYNNSSKILRLYLNLYKYAITICDYEGCGVECDLRRIDIEQKIEADLDRNGWTDRCASIVVDPEIENWIWVHYSHMQHAINWNRPETIHQWASNNGWLKNNNNKPSRPKEAFEAALKLVRTPRSSALYKQIASSASYKKCTDPAFNKLLLTLKQWIQ